jgi:hypothetical protein
VVAVAVVLVAISRLSPAKLRFLGSLAIGTGTLGLLVFIGWELANWLIMVPTDYRRYSFQRILFAIGTNTDVPLVQLTVAGAVCWFVGTLRNKRSPMDIHRDLEVAGSV